MRALLDVNVLIALLDSDHVDHDRARDWMVAESASGWASCAITENGFVRIVSQPGYPNPVSPSDALQRLADAASTEHHVYWHCGVSILDKTLIKHSRLYGHRQVTDAYLLALAVSENGRLVTFDTAVPIKAVRGATAEGLVVL